MCSALDAQLSMQRVSRGGVPARHRGRAVARAAAYQAGDNKVIYAQLVNFYRSRIAVAVQRGNAIVVNRWLYAP